MPSPHSCFRCTPTTATVDRTGDRHRTRTGLAVRYPGLQPRHRLRFRPGLQYLSLCFRQRRLACLLLLTPWHLSWQKSYRSLLRWLKLSHRYRALHHLRCRLSGAGTAAVSTPTTRAACRIGGRRGIEPGYIGFRRCIGFSTHYPHSHHFPGSSSWTGRATVTTITAKPPVAPAVLLASVLPVTEMVSRPLPPGPPLVPGFPGLRRFRLHHWCRSDCRPRHGKPVQTRFKVNRDTRTR